MYYIVIFYAPDGASRRWNFCTDLDFKTPGVLKFFFRATCPSRKVAAVISGNFIIEEMKITTTGEAEKKDFTKTLEEIERRQ